MVKITQIIAPFFISRKCQYHEWDQLLIFKQPKIGSFRYLRILKPLSLQYLLAVGGSFGIGLLPRIRRDWSDIWNPIHVHTEPNFQPIACRIHRYFADKTQAKNFVS